MTREEAEAFDACIAAGGIALFPSDTVYGLAADPESDQSVGRLYELKGRQPTRPAALMFFDLALALTSLEGLGPRTRAAAERLLPGPFTLVVPNPTGRYRLACGPRPDRLGVRVPALSGRLEPLAAVRRPVLQSSANRSGGPDARRLEDVDPHIREGVDLELDGGALPGQASTVVDLGAYEDAGHFEVVREGAVSATEVAALL